MTGGARLRVTATLSILLPVAGIAAGTSIAGGATQAGLAPPIVLVAGSLNNAAGDIYLVRADGTGFRRLRAWPQALKDGRVYGASAAQWSADGRKIGLTLAWWCGDPCRRLAWTTPDGWRLHTVAVPADVSSATWSPHRQAVVTTFQRDALWTTSMDGGKATRICCSQGHTATDPAWSPDGRELVAATSHGLVRMTSDGTNVVPLTGWSRDSAPRWSPDGHSIAFIRQSRCSGEFDCAKPDHVYLVAPDRSGVRRLKSTAGVTSFLWLHDGRSIAFDVAKQDVQFKLNVVRLADGRTRALATGHFGALLTASPDGRKILFSRNDELGDALWSVNDDGSGRHRIHRVRGTVLTADWRG